MGIYIKVEFHVHIHREGQKSERCADNKTENQTIETASFLVRAQQQIEELSRTRSLSTIENYRTALRSFGKYLKGCLPTTQLNAELMQTYERWLKTQHVSKNTISCYMRSLRALTVRICGEDSLSIYNKVYTGRSKTEKRAVKQDELMRIRNGQITYFRHKTGQRICINIEPACRKSSTVTSHQIENMCSRCLIRYSPMRLIANTC